jgi:exopolyphosphatase / guanosine-5'-triphosphate,3'-diphosphate pyrophosphatase
MHGTGPVAAVDCGTNSTRLLIVDRSGRPLTRLLRITRLGEGVDASGSLSPAAIQRTVDVLQEMRVEMDARAVTAARLVATSAVRDAANREEFLEAATKASGVPAEVLSGEEEGAVAYAGATAGLEPGPGDDVVVDIGGGSTELVLGRNGTVSLVSLQLGCVRLTERHFVHDPPTGGEIDRAVADVDAELERAVTEVRGLGRLRADSRMIGLAGTVSTLAALDQGLEAYDRARIHHYVLAEPAVARWVDVLLAESASARGARPGVAPGRQDVIAAGALVLRQTMRRLGLGRCLVSESDILDGLVSGLLGAGETPLAP